MSEEKLEITIIGERVFLKYDVCLYIVFSILFIGIFLGIGFLIGHDLKETQQYDDYLDYYYTESTDVYNVGTIIGFTLIGIVFVVVIDIYHYLTVRRNHNAIDYTVSLREDNKLILYDVKSDKKYIDLETIYKIKAKPYVETVFTGYFFSRTEYNFGKLYIYTENEDGSHSKHVVKEVLNPNGTCAELLNLILPDNTQDSHLYDE